MKTNVEVLMNVHSSAALGEKLGSFILFFSKQTNVSYFVNITLVRMSDKLLPNLCFDEKYDEFVRYCRIDKNFML